LKLTACIQLAQIAAKLGATTGAAFRFATQDRQLRATDKVVLYDQDGTLEELFPENWRSAHLLHPTTTDHSRPVHLKNGSGGFPQDEQGYWDSYHWSASKQICGAGIRSRPNYAAAVSLFRSLTITRRITS